MSDWSGKQSEASMGGRARRKLDLNCRRRPGIDTPARCSGIECGGRFLIEESDGLGPLIVTIRPMLETQVWRRVEKLGKGEYLFELVAERLPLPFVIGGSHE